MALHFKTSDGITHSFSTIVNCIQTLNKLKFEGVVKVDKGIYKEKIHASLKNIIFQGEDGTIFTYDDWAGKTDENHEIIGTTKSASFTLDEESSNVTFKNITFENSYKNSGEHNNSQAVSFKSLGDQIIYINCQFIGKQDTLYLDEGRHYLKDCYIEGTVDFIFGGAVALFDNCKIVSLERNHNPKGYITASRTNHNKDSNKHPYGFVFNRCNFTSEITGDLNEEDKVYLGRPWRKAPSVLIAHSHLDNHISTYGWTDMHQNSHVDAHFYEYNNFGPGAKLNKYRRQISEDDFNKVTKEAIFNSSFNRKWVLK